MSARGNITSTQRPLLYEQFLDIAISLRGDSARRNDRRGDPRAPLRGRVIVLPLGLADVSRKLQAAVVYDISRSGLGLILDKPMSPKTALIIGMRRGSDSSLAWVLGQCMNQRKRETGEFRLGIRLVSEVDADIAKLATRGDAEVLLKLNADASYIDTLFRPAAA